MLTLILKNKGFRYLWLASLCSQLGTHICRISLILYLFKITNSVTNVAVLVMLETLPGVIVAPYAGAVIDRLNKIHVMIAADLLRVAFIGFIILAPEGNLIYVMVALHAVATAFFEPARAALIPSLVEKENFARANSVDQATNNSLMIVGPLIGTELYLQAGIKATLLTDAVSFLLSAVFLSLIGIRFSLRNNDAEYQSLAGTIRHGWEYLWQQGMVFHLFTTLFISLLCVGIWMPLAPLFIRDFLHGSERILGIQLGVFSLGAIVGALLCPFLIEKGGRGLLLFLALLAEGLIMMWYSQVSLLILSIAIIFLWGNIVSLILVPYYSLIQELVREEFLGRVFSIAKQIEQLAIVLAVCAAMILSNSLATQQIFLLAGILYFGVIAVSVFTRNGKQLIFIK